jgi:peroxisomal trans-2-enoyl-CoA reductase
VRGGLALPCLTRMSSVFRSGLFEGRTGKHFYRSASLNSGASTPTILTTLPPFSVLLAHSYHKRSSPGVDRGSVLRLRQSCFAWGRTWSSQVGWLCHAAQAAPSARSRGSHLAQLQNNPNPPKGLTTDAAPPNQPACCCAGRDVSKLDAAASRLGAPSRVLAVGTNIRKEDEVKRLMALAKQRFNSIHILVNNAGGQFPARAEDISLKGWQAVIETNLTGAWLCSREVHAAEFREHGGAIVNIVADFKRGFPMMAHTGAARAGVDNLTKTLALEWAQFGVRVNAVAPGIILSDSAARNYADPTMLERAGARTAAQRCGTVEEVSSAVVFLLSPGAAYISGATLSVDGASSLMGPALWTDPPHAPWPKYGHLPPTGPAGPSATPAAKL